MKLVSLNIEGNKHYERIFPFFKKENPDVLCLQEVLEDDMSFLGEKLEGMKGIFYPFSYTTSKHPSYESMYGKKFGVAIFTREEPVSSGYFYYWGKEEYSSVPFEDFLQDKNKYENHVLAWVTFSPPNGATYKVITAHFPVTERGESTEHQLDVLGACMLKLKELGDFALCGDFNAPRGNKTFEILAKEYKDNIPHSYMTSLDQNLHRIPGLQFMVDGLFTTEKVRAENVALCDGVSDHMAIVATLEVKE
jgi:endonuclease/exonuclease/phosphatase family metal-dependent hydrolase